MTGFYRVRSGPVHFASALINGGTANHGVPRPLWDYRSGAGYAGAVGGNAAESSFPQLESQSSFAVNALPANSVTISSTDANLRVLCGVADGNNYIDAIVRTQEYEIWDGDPGGFSNLGDSSGDLSSCLFPAAAMDGAGLKGKYLLFEVGRVTDGQRVVLANAKVPSNDYFNSFYDGGLNPYNLTHSLSLSVVVHEDGAALAVAMFMAGRQRNYSEAEQRAASHHWLTASTSGLGIGDYCGIGKATAGPTFYTGVAFRNIHSPVLVPVNNAYSHDASTFGGVFQPKVMLSGAEPDYLAVRASNSSIFPADMLPSMMEFKPQLVDGQVQERLPDGAPFTRLGESHFATAQGGIKAALTPGTKLSQSILSPPQDGFPSWSNVEQESPAYIDVTTTIQQHEFGQWMPESVRCYKQDSNGYPYSATDCVYVGVFVGHLSARGIDASQFGDGQQTMVAGGNVCVLVSPSYGPRLYWDGTRWTQRYRYAAMFAVRVAFDYSQTTHQRIGGSFTIGERGVAVLTSKLTWHPADGILYNSLPQDQYYTKGLPPIGITPSGVADPYSRLVAVRKSFVSGQWADDTPNVLPSNCGSPAFGLA